MKKKKKVMFISSTGGHLSEMLELSSLFSLYKTTIVTEKTKSNLYLKDKYKDVYYLVYGTKSHFFTYIFKFIYNFFKSFYLFLKLKPDVIVTTGTHTAVSMCYIAKLFRKRIIFIETLANRTSRTLAGSMIYPIADYFLVQWESMLKLYPKAIYSGFIF